MQHNNAHAVLGGLAVTGVFLGVIVTMEPASRLVHMPLAGPRPAAPYAKYLLMDMHEITASAHLMQRTRPRTRIPSASQELE